MAIPNMNALFKPRLLKTQPDRQMDPVRAARKKAISIYTAENIREMSRQQDIQDESLRKGDPNLDLHRAMYNWGTPKR